MKIRREDTIADVLEASDGAFGIVDDGTGPRSIHRIVPSWYQQKLPAQLERRASWMIDPSFFDDPQRLDFLSTPKPVPNWCKGSGTKSAVKPFKSKGLTMGVCRVCRKRCPVFPSGPLAHHEAKSDDPDAR